MTTENQFFLTVIRACIFWPREICTRTYSSTGNSKQIPWVQRGIQWKYALTKWCCLARLTWNAVCVWWQTYTIAFATCVPLKYCHEEISFLPFRYESCRGWETQCGERGAPGCGRDKCQCDHDGTGVLTDSFICHCEAEQYLLEKELRTQKSFSSCGIWYHVKYASVKIML